MTSTLTKQVFEKLDLIAKLTEGNEEIKKGLLIVNRCGISRLVRIDNSEETMWIDPIIGYIKKADIVFKFTFQSGGYTIEKLNISCMKFIDYIYGGGD